MYSFSTPLPCRPTSAGTPSCQTHCEIRQADHAAIEIQTAASGDASAACGAAEIAAVRALAAAAAVAEAAAGRGTAHNGQSEETQGPQRLAALQHWVGQSPT
jgi:hypothetical protein